MYGDVPPEGGFILYNKVGAAPCGRPPVLCRGMSPYRPIGEGLAPLAGFRKAFILRGGFHPKGEALWGGAPSSRRALRASWSTGGGRVRVPPLQCFRRIAAKQEDGRVRAPHLQCFRRITAKTDNGRTLCAPTAAQGNHSRGERHFADGSPPKPTKTAATFPGTLQQYFAKIQLCNNHVAILRFCYTSPKPVDGGLALEYSMNTGKGRYAPIISISPIYAGYGLI